MRKGIGMLAQTVTYTDSGGGFASVLAILLTLLWIVMIVVFIQMAINVGKIRRMMEHDRRALAPSAASPDPTNPR
jgi:uncharacterized membrane protein